MKRSRCGRLLGGAPVAVAAAALAICGTTTPCRRGTNNNIENISPTTTAIFPPAAGFNFFAEAAPASPFPYREEQPDGRQTPSLHMVGGPRHHYEEDEAGFVVVNEVEEADDDGEEQEDADGPYYRSANQFGGGLLSSFGGASGGKLRTQDNITKKKWRRKKWKVYADVNAETGTLQSSHVKVGRANPRKAGLQFHLRPQGDQAIRGELFSFRLHVASWCRLHV